MIALETANEARIHRDVIRNELIKMLRSQRADLPEEIQALLIADETATAEFHAAAEKVLK